MTSSLPAKEAAEFSIRMSPKRLNRSAERHAFGWVASRSWLTHKRERRNEQNLDETIGEPARESLATNRKIEFCLMDTGNLMQHMQVGRNFLEVEVKTNSREKRQTCDQIAPRREQQQQQQQKQKHLHEPKLAVMSLSWWPANANKVIKTNCCLLLALTLLAMTSTGALANQRFTKQPAEHYQVEAGGSLMIPCQVEDRKGQCGWLGGDGKILAPGRRYVYARDPSDNNCGIRIQNISVLVDDGFWQCQLVATDNSEMNEGESTIQSRLARVTVLVAPERPQIKDLSQGLAKLQVKENEKHEVICEIRGGNPEPQIHWFLDNKPIGGGQNIPQPVQRQADDETRKKSPAARLTQSRLLLNPVSRSMNEKNLTCVGVHPTRNQSASITLDVHYKPNAKLESKEVTLVEGSPLHVQCQVDSNPPASKITWNFVNEPNASKEISVVSIQQGPFLALDQVTRSYDRVKYECVAQNSVGISQPAEVRFNVLYPPRAINVSGSGHVSLGHNQKLQCLFEGNPKPEIRWFYQDPLSRTATSVPIDSSKTQSAAQQDQQLLLIKNVTYRNEGEYYCEARNSIHGQSNSVRSSPISLDVMGEPQFLAKAPVYTKVVQGVKSDIALTFCSDPTPLKIYWQFGSIQLELKSPFQSNSAGDQRPVPPVGHQTLAGRQLQQNLANKYHVNSLQMLQKRETQFSKPATCFEATLSLLEPELSDQRDYLLHVMNAMGTATGVVKVHVSSPLSPALMITSAFVFIFGLFLCSLLFLFVFKKRQQLLMNRASSSRRGAPANGSGAQPNGNSQTANGHGRNRLGRKSDLDLGQQAGKNYQQQQQHAVTANGNKLQTNGLVLGMANGLPNGSANNSLEQQQQIEANGANGKHLVHGLMSMASSESSCNDQKQLLASNCSSDRNSSVGGGSSNGVAIDVHGVGGANRELGGYSNHAQSNASSNSTDRSTANSSPSPLNHISVDDELNLNGTYQATEPVTRGLKLSPMMMGSGGNGQIYANIDYTARANQEAGDTSRTDSALRNGGGGGGGSEFEEGLENSAYNVDERALSSNRSSMSSSTAAALRRSQHTPQLSSPSGSVTTVQENLAAAASPKGPNPQQASPMSQRASVGATIALMNSLAAAQSAAATVSSQLGQPQQQQVGALNGAISQQMMANRVRKPGPPKPPKPSIQQRSRFYQQQQRQLNQTQPTGGLVMIGDSQMGTAQMTNTNGANNLIEAETGRQNQTDDLAAEYSRLAFPARADL